MSSKWIDRKTKRPRSGQQVLVWPRIAGRATAFYGSRIAIIADLEACYGREPVALNILFDGPPSHHGGRFVEVEDDDGRSVRAGEWVKRDDGYYALRIAAPAESLAVDEEMVMRLGRQLYPHLREPFAVSLMDELRAALNAALRKDGGS